MSTDVSNVLKALKYQNSETFHINEFEKRKWHRLYKSIHRKLKHIPKYTVSGPNQGNKTKLSKLYCYLQLNGSLKVQMFYNPAEIDCIHIPCSVALKIDLKGVTPIVFN